MLLLINFVYFIAVSHKLLVMLLLQNNPEESLRAMMNFFLKIDVFVSSSIQGRIHGILSNTSWENELRIQIYSIMVNLTFRFCRITYYLIFQQINFWVFKRFLITFCSPRSTYSSKIMFMNVKTDFVAGYLDFG